MKKGLDFDFSQLRYTILNHFLYYKKVYIICAIIVVIGLLTGFFTAFKFGEGITSDHITDVILVDYLKNNAGWFAILMSRIFSYICLCCFLVILCLNKWTSILSLLVLVYKSYLVGLNSAILIILFNVSGAINVFVVYLPCNLLSLCALLSFNAVLLRTSWVVSRYKQNILTSSFVGENICFIVTIFIIAITSFILEIIFMPAFCSAFFVAFS